MAINMIATQMMQRKGLYWHLLPTYNQGRKIVWNGFTKDGRRFLDHIPEGIRKRKNDTDMLIETTFGSIYQVVGTDDVDKLVGTNPIGCVFSEYALHDPAAWDYIRPILAENDGWAFFIYTARGRNHGYDLIEMAKKNKKWFSSVLIAGDNGTKRPDGSPVISDEIIQEEREANMPEETIQQEFYCSFDAPVVGAYYGKQMMRLQEEERICTVPHDPLLKVHTAWDLGIRDSMAIGFYQEYGFEQRCIDYYEMSGEGAAHYAKVLNSGHRREYDYGIHYAPHDIEVREIGTGKSRRETFKEHGIKFKVVKKHDVDDGIEAVRNMLPFFYFSDRSRALEEGGGPMRLVECLRQYRKEYDEKKKCYLNNPFHDWTSHGCDQLRIYCMGKKKRKKSPKDKLPKSVGMNYDPLARR